jgi:hypothetical protein
LTPQLLKSYNCQCLIVRLDAQTKGMQCMNPTVITYIGFVVAVLILAWGGIELGKRYFAHRRIDARAMNAWVPLKPDSVSAEPPNDPLPNTDEDDAEDPLSDIHRRAKQNGHYSQSKKLL